MRKSIAKAKTLEERELEGGIEWVFARELVPVQDELTRLRAQVEALRQAMQPW